MVVEHYGVDVPGAAVTFSTYQGPPLATEAPRTHALPVSIQRFALSGVLKSVDADNRRVVVEHGDIPGLMGAMTMSYRVGPREDLKSLAAGARIHSDVVVSETGSHLENIQVTAAPK